MKSFSFKALVLAFVVITGSAQGYTGETTVNNLFQKVSRPYSNLCNKILDQFEGTGYHKAEEIADTILFFPVDHYILSRTIFAIGVTAAAYKTYKHFTKPAADATESEAVEANEANTVA